MVGVGVGCGAAQPWRPSAADPLAALPWLFRLEIADLSALADSAAVAAWPDRLGVYDAAQATAGARPTYRTAATYGEPAILFGPGNSAWKYLAIAGLTTTPPEYAVRMRFPTGGGNDASAYYGGPLAGTSAENPAYSGYFLDLTESNRSKFTGYGRAWLSRGAEQGTDLDTRLYGGTAGQTGWCGTLNGTAGLDSWFGLRVRPAGAGASVAALLLNGVYGTNLIMSRVWAFSRQLTAPEAALVDATLGA